MIQNKVLTKIGLLICITFFYMTTALAQYQPLYKTIPNNIPSKNQEAESSSTGILIVEKVSLCNSFASVSPNSINASCNFSFIFFSFISNLRRHFFSDYLLANK